MIFFFFLIFHQWLIQKITETIDMVSRLERHSTIFHSSEETNQSRKKMEGEAEFLRFNSRSIPAPLGNPRSTPRGQTAADKGERGRKLRKTIKRKGEAKERLAR